MFLNFFTFKFNFSLNSGEDDNAGPAHSALPAGPAAPRSVRHFKKDAPHAPALSCESPSRAEMTIPVLRSSEFKGIKPPFEKKKKKKRDWFPLSPLSPSPAVYFWCFHFNCCGTPSAQSGGTRVRLHPAKTCSLASFLLEIPHRAQCRRRPGKKKFADRQGARYKANPGFSEPPAGFVSCASLFCCFENFQISNFSTPQFSNFSNSLIS